MKPIIFIVFILLLLSCEELPTQKNENVIIANYNLASYLSGVSSTLNGWVESNESSYGSLFTKQSHHSIFYTDGNRNSTYDVGNLSLNLNNFTKDNNNQYYLGTDISNANEIILNIGGNSLSGIPTVSDTMYYPSSIFFDNLNLFATKSISGFDLEWNNDESNANNVLITIAYDHDLTDREFPSNTFSNNYNKKIFIETQDDGFYNVSLQDLVGFERNSVVRIEIFRGNIKVCELKNKYDYGWVTYTMDYYPIILN